MLGISLIPSTQEPDSLLIKPVLPPTSEWTVGFRVDPR